MADENRMITFEYAKATYDEYKKQIVPNTKEAMTKSDIINYFNVDEQVIQNRTDNQLVPRISFVGLLTDYSSFCYHFNHTVYSITIQPDNKILVGGSFTRYKGVVANNIIRLNVDGTIDTTFNSGIGFDALGSLSLPSDTNRSTVYAIKVQSDGKILVGGNFSRYNGVERISFCRLNANGTLDTSVNIGNTVTDFDYFGNSSVVVAGIIHDILIQGSFAFIAGRYNSGSQDKISKVNLSTGALVSTFSPNGIVPTGRSLTTDSTGRLYLGGETSYYLGPEHNSPGYILRIDTTTGVVDQNFKAGSVTTGSIKCIKYEPASNMILFGGSFTQIFLPGSTSMTADRLSRISLTGVIDTTFTANINLDQSVFSVEAIEIDPLGKIIIGTLAQSL